MQNPKFRAQRNSFPLRDESNHNIRARKTTMILPSTSASSFSEVTPPSLVDEDDPTAETSLMDEDASTAVTTPEAATDDLLDCFEKDYLQQMDGKSVPTVAMLPFAAATQATINHQAFYALSYNHRPVDERKLFVGGLPPKLTNKDFRKFFERFGTLLDSVVIVNKESRCPRGFGFVKFQDVQVARKLLAVVQARDGLKMQGKTIDIKIAVTKEGGGIHLDQPLRRGYVATLSYSMMPPELANESTFTYPYFAPPHLPFSLYEYTNFLMSRQCYDPLVIMDPSTGLYYPCPRAAAPFFDPHPITPACSPDPYAWQ